MGVPDFLLLSLCFLFFLPLRGSAVPVPRWLLGEQTHGSGLGAKAAGSSVAFDPTRVTQLSWNPRAFIYKGFLSDDECDHLIKLAREKLEKSMVADNESGKSMLSEVRTSSGMFLLKAQDEVVANIEARIAAWTFLPEVKPKKGDALLFFSLHPDTTTDDTSMHASCPVIEGEKWSATKWIHVRSFDTPMDSVTVGECRDENQNCASWAKVGECEKNPLYMVGSKDVYGSCRKSCGACSS
ncbi:hypothetical protein EUGRSUZ_I01897 [Eucalyptus grandis]|uniref:Uncharacterized protein n=2 Tax=Eucalyptus grandis TaxID=71139 RepID=A0ACC3JGW3_EUCGR|nr:hypothetical protein EUGRSUZ_I01897 [Eucalyptus grandis]